LIKINQAFLLSPKDYTGNINRFPKNFMFTLTAKEYENLKSQNATSSLGERRRLSNTFIEQ
jgi:ORF6N domain